jgi:hypothetical protein
MLIQYGATTNFVVSYDSTFTGTGGQPNGPALAQGVLDYCEYDLTRLSILFGNILPPAANLPIQINLVPGSGGADNNGTNTINCFCDTNTEPIGLPALVVAEEAEIFMVLQNKGWIAGWSNGEALSRVSAQILYPNRAWLFSTGDNWLNAGRPDWVDNVEHTDQDLVSVGCGSLFLNYLAYQLNFEWPDIIQAGAPNTNTLAETAEALGVANPWQNFINLINADLPSGSSLPSEPTAFGQAPEPTDDPFPYGPLPAQVPALYMRHNLADNGTSHTGSLSDSPDIIMKNNPVADPQATFSTPASIASDTESDPDVLTGQTNYVYLRVWNRGAADAENVFATVYWSPPSTLVSPSLWNLIGCSYFPVVPAGSVVQVSDPGITWPSDQLPPPGHNCFVATVGDNYAPAPNSGSFASFAAYENFIYANNDITWRNFNVVLGAQEQLKIRFFIAGAWDVALPFALEVEGDLPEGSRLALQVPDWIGKGLKPQLPRVEEAAEGHVHLPLPLKGRHALGTIELPAKTAAESHVIVEIPPELHRATHRLVVRQLRGNQEAGRITWVFQPRRRPA